MKKIFVMLLCVLYVTSISSFAYSDIFNAELSEKVDVLAKFGIINGYEDGTFRPENNITRAEFSKIICTTGIYDTYKNAAVFSDVSPEHWAAEYIYSAKSMGIINGTTATTFEPEAYITYEQTIKMIVAALGYNKEAIENGGYPNGYISIANKLGILEGVRFSHTDYITRADVVRIVRNALDVPFYFLTGDNGLVEREMSGLSLYEIYDITFSAPVVDDEEELVNEEEEKDSVG